MVLYTISTQSFYDEIKQCYKKILTINTKPLGTLKNLVKQINPPKLSPFKQSSYCCQESKCIYAIMNPTNTNELLCIDDIPELFSFVSTHPEYSIDTNITNMMNNSDVKMNNKLLCFIKYSD